MSPDLTQWTSLGGLVGLIGYIIWQDWRAGKLSKGISNEAKESYADTRNALQPLLSQMELLSTHFNHTTTDQNERVIEKLEDMYECLKKSNTKLEEIQKYGVKILKE